VFFFVLCNESTNAQLCFCWFITQVIKVHGTNVKKKVFYNRGGECLPRGTDWILGVFAKLRKATISFIAPICSSVCVAHLGSHRKNFREILYLRIFENMLRKSKFCQNLTRITDTLNEDFCAFIVISPSCLLGMRNVSDQICKENQNTYFMFNNIFFSWK